MADLLLVLLRDVERRDHLHGLADVARTALGAERRVGGIKHVVGAVEFEPAHCSDAAAAERGIGVEVAEAIHQRFAQHLEDAAVVLVRGPAAQRGPAGVEAGVEERDHRTEVMDQDLQIGQSRGHAGEDEPRHGAAGLVGPAEDRPDLVFRLGLGREVRHVGRARGMQQHRLARLGRDLEDRKETRLVEASAIDVGMELQAVGIAVNEDALRLLRGGVGRPHWQASDIASEAVGILGAELGEPVVRDAGEFRRLIGPRHDLDRRQTEGEDLRIIRELIHHLQARIEIENRAHALDALADVPGATRGLRQLLEQARRKEMAERIDVAHCCFPLLDRQAVRLDHLGRPQRGDLFATVAELGQDFVGVLSQRRRRKRAFRARAVDAHGTMNGDDLAFGRMALLVEGLEMAHLRVIEDRGQIVDGRKRHVVPLEHLHPMDAQLLLHDLREHLRQRAEIADAQIARGEALVAHQVRALECGCDRLEEFRLRREVDCQQLAVAAAERKGLRRSHPRQPVALDAGPGIVRERIRDEGDRRLQHIDVDAPSATAALALVERAEDAIGREHAGGVVGDRRAARLWRFGVDLEAQDAAERHRDIVVGGPRAVGPGRPEAGDRAVDQAGIGGRQHIVREAQPLHDPGAIVLEQDVGAFEQRQQHRTTGIGAQIERDAALAAVIGDEVRTVIAAAEAAERVAGGRLDFDDLGAEIGEHQPGERCRDHVSYTHLDVYKRQDHIRLRETRAIHQLEIEVGDIVDAVEPVRQRGFAEARMRRRDHAAILREPFDERHIHADTGAAMQPEERSALPALEHFELDACDRNHVGVSRCLRVFVWRVTAASADRGRARRWRSAQTTHRSRHSP